MIVSYLAFVCIVFGALGVWSSKEAWQRRQRVLATPLLPASQTGGAGSAQLRGTVVAYEDGVVEAPVAGIPVVWCKTVVEQYVRGKYGGWKTLVEGVEGHPFLLDDGSDRLAWVDPTNAFVEVDENTVDLDQTAPEVVTRVHAWLRSKGIDQREARSLRALEFRLAPGDTISALGLARSRAVTSGKSAYRDSRRDDLELYGDPSAPVSQLSLSSRSPAERVKHLGQGLYVSGGLLLFGTTLALFAALR